MNIIQAIHDERFFRPLFKDLETWQNWLTFLKVLFALPLTDKRERRLFRKCTGRRRPPTRPAKEVFAIVGRRGGKSFIVSILCVFLAIFKDWQPFLSPGERGWIFIIATDKLQAKIIKDYISGILNSTPLFRKMIKRDLTWEIELTNNINIAVKTCNFRSIRGYTVVACVLEEMAFFRFSEESANPDKEILTALRPGLSTIPDSLLVAISTPYSRYGVLWEMFQSHFGKNEKNGQSPLIWQSSSLTMNPSLNEQLIKNALKEDYAAGKAEWLGEFREDLELFLSLELIEAAVIPGRLELPKIQDTQYFGFVDPSGGRQDSFTLAVSHKDSNTGKVVLDCLREARPPFTPSEIVKDFSRVLKAYGIGIIESDRYGAEWVSSAFRDNGIMLENSELTTSEIYLNFLPLIANRNVELLDNRRLILQLRGLERKTRSGGKDIVTHNPGGSDDLCNSCTGACLIASRTESFRLALPSLGYLEPDETLKERLDRESRLWLLNKPPPEDDVDGFDESEWDISRWDASNVAAALEDEGIEDIWE